MKGVTRENLAAIDKQILVFAQAVCKEYGVAVKLGRGHYSPTGTAGDIKLVLSAIGEGGEDLKELRDWERVCSLFALTKDDYKGEFSVRGDRFQMVSLSTNRPKYPLGAVMLKTGKRYKFSRDIIVEYLKAEGRKVPAYMEFA